MLVFKVYVQRCGYDNPLKGLVLFISHENSTYIKFLLICTKFCSWLLFMNVIRIEKHKLHFKTPFFLLKFNMLQLNFCIC